MIFSEFVEGTGCRENDHNYEVYKNLEIMYMHSDLSKQQIYEYGKKLVDNTPSEEELRAIEENKQLMKEYDEKIKAHKKELERYQEWLKIEDDKDMKKIIRDSIKFEKGAIASYRSKKHFMRMTATL